MGGLIFSHGLLIAQSLPRSTSPEVESKIAILSPFFSLSASLSWVPKGGGSTFRVHFQVAGPGKFITHVVGDSGAAGSRPIGTRNALHQRARCSRDAYAVLLSCILVVGMTTQLRKMHPMFTCDCLEESETSSSMYLWVMYPQYELPYHVYVCRADAFLLDPLHYCDGGRSTSRQADRLRGPIFTL